MSAASKNPAAVPEDLPLKRNEAYGTVSRVSMQKNEAYSVAVSLQKNEIYESPLPEVPMQQNEAYVSVVRPATTMDIQTCPEYEIVQ